MPRNRRCHAAGIAPFQLVTHASAGQKLNVSDSGSTSSAGCRLTALSTVPAVMPSNGPTMLAYDGEVAPVYGSSPVAVSAMAWSNGHVSNKAGSC